MIVKGITIHNTGNIYSAQENYNKIKLIKKPNLCHYLIDEKEIINTWPEQQEASHTGKGYDYGNLHTIAIEICRSQCEKELYLKAQSNAVAFILSLLEKYDLSIKDIYFHNDFDENSWCPHRIIELYGNKETFINQIVKGGKQV